MWDSASLHQTKQQQFKILSLLFASRVMTPKRVMDSPYCVEEARPVMQTRILPAACTATPHSCISLTTCISMFRLHRDGVANDWDTVLLLAEAQRQYYCDR